MEMKKWLFEANGKEEVNEEPIEQVNEEPIEEVVEEVVEDSSGLQVGDTKEEGGYVLYWTGEAWLDYVNYKRATGNH